jgi:sigma-B regulation protein RsbQ
MPTGAIARNNVQVHGQGRETLVFGHGLGTDQRAWRFVAPRFADRRRIVTFDHVGFGGSDRAAYADLRYRTLEGYALDLVDVLDDLGIERATYVGHSIGGVIGMLASLAAPERFERLVLVGSSPRFINDPPDYVGGFEREDIEGILDAMESDQLAWSQSLAPVAMGDQSPDALVSEFGNTLSALDPLIARTFGRAVFTVDCRDRVPLVRVPTLVLQCTNDSIVPRGVGEWLRRQLPHGTLRELEASGHCPHLTHPDETAGAIADYLGSANG